MEKNVGFWKLLRTSRLASWAMMRTFMSYLLFGLLGNWGFLVYLYYTGYQNKSAQNQGDLNMALYTGLAMASLGILLPLLYAWVGRNQALAAGLKKLYAVNKINFQEKLSTLLLRMMEETQDEEGQLQLDKMNYRGLERQLMRLEEMPAALRWLFQLLFEDIPVQKLVKEVAKKKDFSHADRQHATLMLTDRFDTYIRNKVLSKSKVLSYVLVMVNLSIMGFFLLKVGF